MKKILCFFILFFLLFGFSNIFINATEYFPVGINYFNPDNIHIQREGTIDYAVIIGQIKVKPNTSYTVCVKEEAFTIDAGVDLYCHDSTKTIIGGVIDEMGDMYCAPFTTQSNTVYISGRIALFNLEEVYDNNNPLSNYLVLYEGTPMDYDFNEIDSSFQGFDVNFVAKGNKITGDYYVDVEHPVTSDEIKSAIKAIDNYDGDITDQIESYINEYDDNMDFVGDYKLGYQVSDSSGNTSKFLINVHVKDLIKPKVKGELTYNVEPTDNFSIDQALDNIVITDNYDGAISTENIVLISDGFTGNSNKLGSYYASYYVEDSSHNRAQFTIVVNVRDKIAPVFSGEKTYNLPVDARTPISEITSQMSALDSFEGNLTENITIASQNYEGNEGRLGTYTIVYSVKDSSKNTSNYQVTVNVYDDVPPVFYVTEMIINIQTNYQLSAKRLKEMVLLSKQISKYDTIEISGDEYLNSYDKAGEYEVTVTVDNQEYIVQINVIDNLYEEVATNKKKTFFERMSDGFKKVISDIKKFLNL